MIRLVNAKGLTFSGSLRGKALETHLDGDIDGANLKGLGVTGSPYMVSAAAVVDVKGNISKPYLINATVNADEFKMTEHRERRLYRSSRAISLPRRISEEMISVGHSTEISIMQTSIS